MSGTVDVTLDGQKYVLRTNDQVSEVQEAAKTVNEYLAKVRATTKLSSPTQVALLAALNMALRLQTVSKDVEQFKENTSDELKKLIELVQEEAQSVQPQLGGTA